eukprot:Pgem_evm1s2175
MEYNLFKVPKRTIKSNEKQIRRRNKYLQQINRRDIFEQEAKGKYKEYCLCEKHFEERCFKINKNGRKYLITSEDVYPTLYMGYFSLTKNLCDERLIQKKNEREVRAAKRIKLTEEIEVKERKRMEYESNNKNNISDFDELKEKIRKLNISLNATKIFGTNFSSVYGDNDQVRETFKTKDYGKVKHVSELQDILDCKEEVNLSKYESYSNFLIEDIDVLLKKEESSEQGKISKNILNLMREQYILSCQKKSERRYDENSHTLGFAMNLYSASTTYYKRLHE